MLVAKKEQIQAAKFRDLVKSLKPEDWQLLEQQINAHGFGRTCSTVTYGWIDTFAPLVSRTVQNQDRLYVYSCFIHVEYV